MLFGAMTINLPFHYMAAALAVAVFFVVIVMGMPARTARIWK